MNEWKFVFCDNMPAGRLKNQISEQKWNIINIRNENKGKVRFPTRQSSNGRSVF